MKMTVAEYVISHLYDVGVRYISLVYGSATASLVDAIGRHGKMKFICFMQEQGAGFFAEGISKINAGESKQIGVVCVTSGPGSTNAITNLSSCHMDSTPLLVLTGNVHSRFQTHNHKEIRMVGFQEVPIVDIASPTTKYAVSLKKPTDVRYELEKCLYLATSGRPSSVLLDIPLDIQKAEIETDTLIGFSVYPEGVNQNYLDNNINLFIDDLEKCKRPILIAGGGIRSAGCLEDFHTLLDLIQIPAAPTYNALDIVHDKYEDGNGEVKNNPYYAGLIGTYSGKGRNFCLQNADLCLALSRVSGRVSGSNLKAFIREGRKYIVDIDPGMLQPHTQQIPFDVSILCDYKIFIKRMIELLKERNYKPRHSEWVEQCQKWKDKYDPVKPEFFKEQLHPYAFTRLLSQKLSGKRGDLVVADVGGTVILCNHSFEPKKHGRFFSNNGYSCMSQALGMGMGCCSVYPDKNVFVLIGDGSLAMACHEFQTIVNNKDLFKNLKIVCYQNLSYGITRSFQRLNFPNSPSIACDASGGWRPPDFMKVSAAYGIKAVQIQNISEADKQINEILSIKEPVYCEVYCPGFSTYEPKTMGWDSSLETLYPFLKKEEFLDNMYIEPLPGYEKFTT